MDMHQEQAKGRRPFCGWLLRPGMPPTFVDCTPQARPALLSRRLADYALHQMTPAEIADKEEQR